MSSGLVQGVPLHIFDTTDSTMDQGKELAKAGFRGIVMAYEQTHGRGIGPRKWHSPRGGLYLTWVMDYEPGSARTEFGEVLMHMAAVRTLRSYRVQQPMVRAPNDLYVGEFKIGGSLKWYFPFGMLLGYGINLDLAEGSVDGIATSIKALTGHAPSSEEALQVFVRHTQEIQSSFPRELKALKEEWTRVQLTLPDTDTIDDFTL